MVNNFDQGVLSSLAMLTIILFHSKQCLFKRWIKVCGLLKIVDFPVWYIAF